MARRLHKTWADYMVIGISPALIIVMIWSLVAFLLAGGYRGPYSLRVSFIFAMFVMGAVLTTRISIEDGREYAALFAIPLAIAMGLAAVRFTPIGGLSLLLILLIWWCASKLTWDCTVIDEAEDASGEGLLQVMGLEGEGEGEETDAPTVAATDGASIAADARPAPDDTRTPRVTEDPIAWWRARVARRRQRRHAPGLWVIYFALVALPIFGLLHRYIPATDAARRRAAFFLLCTYVASSLGLLMTTSFLNLRRYLRQRRLQMPTEMAGMWLSIGALLIAMVLIACVVLPRPGAAVAISQLPFSIHWPDYRKPNRFAVGGEGVQSDQQTGRTTTQKTGEHGAEARHGRKGSAPSKSKSGRSASADQSGKRTGRSQSGTTGQSAKHGDQPGTKSQQRAGKPAHETQKSSPGTQSGKSAVRNPAPSRPGAKTGSRSPAGRKTQTPSRNSSSAKSPTRPTKAGGQNKTRRASDNGSNSARRHDAPNRSGQTQQQKPQQQPRSGQMGKQSESASKQPSPPRQAPAQARPKNKPTGQPPSRAGQQRQSGTSSKAASGRSGQSKRAQSSSRSMFSDGSKQNAVEKPSATSKTKTKTNAASPRQPASARPSPARSISKLFSATTSVFGKILKVLFVLGLFALVAFLAWKYRETIQQALRQLLDDLRRIWASLFGGQREAKSADVAAEQESAPQGRTFASFSNPFVSGTAERWTMEQTVHYTFAALEAWADEQDSGRASEQTPLEFAQELAGRFPDIGAEATTLADLYSRVAYGRRRVSKRHEQTLARLWRLMAQTALPRPAVGAPMGDSVANR